MMERSSPNPSRPERDRAGRSLRIWLGVLAAGGAALLVLLLSPRPPSAERSYLRGMRYLVAGDMPAAAEEFESALAGDPGIEGAWHGLLEAAPTLSNCRRCAQHVPGLFDSQQPIRDEASLFSDPSRDGGRWAQSLELYEKAIRGAAEAGANLSPLLLDYDGRRELNQAWQEVRAIRAELEANIREPLPASRFRSFAVYDLPAARKVVQDSLVHFRDPQSWGKLLERMDTAIGLEAAGLAKLDAAAKSDAAFVPAQLTLALVEIARGRPADAASRCRRLLDSAADRAVIPGELHVRYCLARALELAGDYAGSAAELERVLARKPGHTQTALRLGALYLKLERTEEAGALAEALVKGTEVDRRADYIRGVVNLRHGNYETAAAQLGGVLQHRRGDVEVNYYLALALSGAGKHLSALREFTAVAEASFDPAWPLAAAAMSALAAGRGEAADGLAAGVLNSTDVLRAHPVLRSYMLRVRLAAAALAGQRDVADRAIAELAERASEDPDRELVDALIAGVMVGQAYVAAEAEIQVPEQHIEFFRALVPRRPSAQYALAFLLAAAGRSGEARTTLEQLLVAWPKHELAALHLARLHMLEGRTELGARVLTQTGLAEASAEVQRALRLIDALQGVKVAPLRGPRPEPPPEREPLGPHLAFFALAVDEDHRAYAQLMLLLDPVSETTHDILRLVYPYIRTSGPAGLAEAARADENIDSAIRRAVAAYSAFTGSASGLYRLAVGRFWSEMPRHL